MRILVVCPFYLPGFAGGGPIRSISNFVAAVSDSLDVCVYTQDRDLGATEPYPSVEVDAWAAQGSAKVFYASGRMLRFSELRKQIGLIQPDVIYLNSFLSYRFSIQIIVMRYLGLIPPAAILLAPRGEFSPGAWSIRRARKLAWLWLARLSGMLKGIDWQYTSEIEREHIVAKVKPDPERLHQIPNLATRPPESLPPRPAVEASQCPVRIVFLSRIVEKKNLDYALRVLQSATAAVEFSVYGTAEDPVYEKACLREADKLPANVRIAWNGPLAHHEVMDVLAASDLFFFPTKGENFGHVIYESLSVGTPVLISDQTPWRDLQQDHAGADFQLDDEKAFAAFIDRFATFNAAEREQYRNGAVRAARQYYSAQDIGHIIETIRRLPAQSGA